MRHLLLLCCLFVSAIGFSQVIVGGGGIVNTNTDPDNITELQTQDARYEAMMAYDTVARELYVYDGSKVLGNRWDNIPLDAVTDSDTRLNTPTVTTDGAGVTTVSFPIYDEVNDANTGSTIDVIIPRAPIQSIVNGTNVTAVDDGSGNITISVVVDLESTFNATGNGEVSLSNEGSSETVELVGGNGTTITEVSAGRYRINNQVFTNITATNYSDATAQGVQVGEWFIAATQNSMGVIPGTLIQRQF